MWALTAHGWSLIVYAQNGDPKDEAKVLQMDPCGQPWGPVPLQNVRR